MPSRVVHPCPPLWIPALSGISGAAGLTGSVLFFGRGNRLLELAGVVAGAGIVVFTVCMIFRTIGTGRDDRHKIDLPAPKRQTLPARPRVQDRSGK